MSEWKPIENKIEIGNGKDKVETFTLENVTCSLYSCRYNKNGKCTNEKKRKECVEVSLCVLCLEKSDITTKNQ